MRTKELRLQLHPVLSLNGKLNQLKTSTLRSLRFLRKLSFRYSKTPFTPVQILLQIAVLFTNFGVQKLALFHGRRVNERLIRSQICLDRCQRGQKGAAAWKSSMSFFKKGKAIVSTISEVIAKRPHLVSDTFPVGIYLFIQKFKQSWREELVVLYIWLFWRSWCLHQTDQGENID